MKKTVILLLPLLILFSCGVQKRKYQKGFYVSSSRSKTQPKKIDNDHVANKKVTTPESFNPINVALNTEPKTEVEASADIKLKPLKLITKVVFSIQKDEPCDLITLKNGEEVSAKVLEITSIEVKYKKCDSPDGPLYVVKKSDVFMIKYANGTKEVFKNKEEPSTNSQSQSNQNQNNNTGQRTTHELAILALIAGIAGFVFLVGSIPAIIMGNSAIKKINAEPDKYDGLEMAKIGKILGIVGLVLKILFFILLFSLIFSI